VFRRPRGDINGVAFSPNGRQVLVASEACEMFFWDDAAGK